MTGHPLQHLLTLHQLDFEMSRLLHLQELKTGAATQVTENLDAIVDKEQKFVALPDLMLELILKGLFLAVVFFLVHPMSILLLLQLNLECQLFFGWLGQI